VLFVIRPCMNNLRAFAYPFAFASGSTPGGTAVVLCSGWDGAAIDVTANASPEIGTWRTGGDFRVNTQGIDALGRYLSYMIIHELMHAANMQQCK